MRINSPGGDAFEGVAIYNLLRALKKPINVFIDGIAARAGSVQGKKFSYLESLFYPKIASSNRQCFSACIRGVSLLDSPVYSRSHGLYSAKNVTYLFRGNYLDNPSGHPLATFVVTQSVAGIEIT